MNLNKLKLTKSDGHQLDSLFLPPWAMNYHDFVRIMREQLESKYVQKHLCHWIDMLFGVDQQSVKHQNIYFCLAYEEWHAIKKNQ